MPDDIGPFAILPEGPLGWAPYVKQRSAARQTILCLELWPCPACHARYPLMETYGESQIQRAPG